jgi:hypothetical protein
MRPLDYSVFFNPSPTYLEACRTPVNKLDSAFGLDGGNGGLNILGDDIATIQQAARH